MRISIPRFIVATLTAVAMMAGPASLPALADDTKLVDLAVTQNDTPDPVLENGFVTYAVTVSNLGPQPANGIVVNADANKGKYISGSGHRWTCALNTLTAVCEHTGAIDPGSSSTLNLVVQAPASGSNGSTIVHNTTVKLLSTDYQDVFSGNDTDQENTIIGQGADVTVDQSDLPQTVTAGNTVRYLISVNNNNNNVAATGVTLNTTASSGSITRVSGTGWTCTKTTRQASCSYASPVSPNSPAPAVDLQVLTPFSSTASTMSNTASVSSTTADTNQSNNTDVESTSVSAGSNGTKDHVTASGYIDPSGGEVTTCAPGGATSTDNTCTSAVFPAGPGGVATLIEGDPLEICKTQGCTGDSVDVIVPENPGYNFGTHSAIKVYLYVDGSISSSANDATREIYVKKPAPTGQKTEAVAMPSCTARIPGLPCVSAQERIDGDYRGTVELFSQDPIFDVGDGLNNVAT